MVNTASGNEIKLKKLLLEVLKAVILQVIYLYDLQLCNGNVHPIYIRLSDIDSTLSSIKESQVTVNKDDFTEVNGIIRSIGFQIPVYLNLDNDGFANLNDSLSDVRFKLSLLNTLNWLNICFKGHFDITLEDIISITNNMYSLTKEFVQKLSAILYRYDNSGYKNEDEIELSNDGIENLLINMNTCAATFVKIGLPFLEAFGGSSVTTIRMQFILQIPLLMANINEIFGNKFDSYLKQAKLLLNLAQDTYYGTTYDFHKVCSDCINITFYNNKGKCSYYALEGRELTPIVENHDNELKLIINLGNDSQFRKIFNKLNDYLAYINFLLEFRRLFTGDIIDIKNLNDTKITASIELLKANKDIMTALKERKTSRKTQITKLLNKAKKFAQIQTKKKSQQPTQGNNSSTNPNALKQLLQKIIDLCDNYLSNCESMEKKPENVIASYRNKLDKYRELCNQDNMNLQSATDIYIKLMDFTFNVYKLRATLFAENKYDQYAVYKYNGMQNNVKKLKLDISSNIIQENRKNSGPKITSYHSSNDKPLVQQRMLAIEAPRTTPPVPAPRNPVSAQNKPPLSPKSPLPPKPQLPPKPRGLMVKPVTVVPEPPPRRKHMERQKTTGPLNANDPLPELPAKKKKKKQPGNNAKVASTRSPSNEQKSIKVPTQTTSEEKINNPEPMYAQLQHPSTTPASKEENATNPASEKEEVTYSELNHNPKSKKSSLRNSKKPMSTETSTTTNPVNIEGQNLNSAMVSNRKHQRNTISRKGESVRKREESIKKPNVKGLVQMFENRGKHKPLTPRGIRVRQH